jgi:hypothetical protein
LQTRDRPDGLISNELTLGVILGPEDVRFPTVDQLLTTVIKMKPLRVQDLLIPFLLPTLLGKCFILYFGLNYSEYPGEGYGIGLGISIAFTLFMLGRFLWTYRHYQD